MKINKKILVAVVCVCLIAASVFTYNKIINKPMVDGVAVATEENLNYNKIPLGTVKKTKTSVKKSKKVRKIDAPATKTKITTKKNTKKSTKKTDKTKAVVKTTTTVNTTVSTKYTKNSDKTAITTTVKTTVLTATTTKSKWTGNIDNAVPKASSALRKEFKDRGFVLLYNQDVEYAGMFDPGNKQIVLKREDNVAYHEFGHFVSYVNGRAAETSKFREIYKAEKGKYTASNRAYVTQSSGEYFAESYKNYILNPSKIKSERPKTYKFINELL